ncbi:MAG TPA: DUF2121 domain-containing protein [Methanomicrobiales archaeon]|nr:DUF2121 domain-containing protein [Methanomicrobiales archaeon]
MAAVTLVMAFVGESGAVMAGDMREIGFLGDRAAIGRLEEELYSGALRTDGDLLSRAAELGVKLTIRDDKAKVFEEEGVLVGEVTSLEGGLLSKRRLYASAGSYAIVDTVGSAVTVRGRGGASNFVVLGNELAKAVANRMIRERWRDGTLEDAAEILVRSIDAASAASPSVGRTFLIVQTRKRVDLGKILEKAGK